MDFKEFIILIGRIITIFPLLLIIALIMGKRAIGEIPVFDFLIIVSLAAVTGADIADPKIEHTHTAVAIVLIGLFQVIISRMSIKNRWFGRKISFEPTLVIQDGSFLINNMSKIRYSLDNILQMLRENDIFDVNDVAIGIIEANGKLTVQKKPAKEYVRIEDMGIQKSSIEISYPVMIEGRIYSEVLQKLHLEENWLVEQLKLHGIFDKNDVFFASINERHELHISLTKPNLTEVPPILH